MGIDQKRDQGGNEGVKSSILVVVCVEDEIVVELDGAHVVGNRDTLINTVDPRNIRGSQLTRFKAVDVLGVVPVVTGVSVGDHQSW